MKLRYMPLIFTLILGLLNASVNESQAQAKLYQEIPRPQNLAPVYSLAFAPSTDKPTYLLGQMNHFLLTTDTQKHHRIRHPRYYIGSRTVCAAFSHSLKYALGLSKGNLVLLYDALNDESWSSFSTDSTVNAVTFSPDSKIIAVGTAENVSFWNVQTKGKHLRQPESLGATQALAFSPDGKILAIGKMLGTVELWDVNKNTSLTFLRPEVPSPHGIYALTFSPDGKTLAAGKAHNGEIDVWAVPGGKSLGSLKGHQNTATIRSVAFSPNNRTLASCATDGKVLFWDVQTQKKIDPIQHFTQKHPEFSGTGHGEKAEVLSVAFSNDGKTLMSGDATGFVLLWDLSKIDIGTDHGTDRLAQTDTDNPETPHDMTPPTIALSPIPTVTAEARRVTLRGSTTSSIGIQENRIRITNNGKTQPSATLTANGNFAVSIPLNEGDNQITFTVVDKNEQSAQNRVTVHRPLTPPEIEVIEPRLGVDNAADIPQPTQQIRVRITDTSAIARVTLNDREMAPTLMRNVYTLTSPRIVSQTTFTLSAVDTHGSQNSEVFTLNYRQPDDTPPTITIIQPVRDASNTATINTSPFPVTVEVRDESGVQDVRINGVKVAALGENRFSRSISHSDTLNQVDIKATDTVGNTHNTSFRVVYQQKPLLDLDVRPTPTEREDPRVLFTDSKLEDTRRQTSKMGVFTLEFIVLDESRIEEVIVKRSDDGAVYPVSKSGRRDYTAHLQLRVGDNRFEIRVADEWDNIEIETVTLTRIQADTEAPRFTALSVGEGIQVQQIPVRGGYLAYNKPIVVANERLVLRGRLTDESGIATVKVAVNDSAPEGLPLQNGTQFEKRLSLDYGQNQIYVTATDTQGNSDDTRFTIHQRPDRDGKDLALFFATDKYEGKKDTHGHWRDLTTAVADAEQVAKKLRDAYGFKTKVVKNPTGRALMETLIAYQDRFIDENGAVFRYEDGAQLLIYFAGHGYYNKRTAAGYLVTRESEPPSIDPAQFTAVEHSSIRRSIDLIACNRVLVLMDTCFSGTFDPKYNPQTSAQLRSLVEDGTLLDQINMMLKLTARWCLTSASGEYVADTGGTNGHSPFAAAFMAALDTRGGPDTLLELDEIWDKIQGSKHADIYNELEQNPQRAGLETFERPEPRKGQFGAKAELYEESDFLLFPTVVTP